MKKFLKIGMGVLLGAGVAAGATVLYQRHQDQKLTELLAVAKEHFMFDDVLTSWLVSDPVLFHIYEGGIIRADGTVVKFEIDADSLSIIDTIIDKDKVGV